MDPRLFIPKTPLPVIERVEKSMFLCDVPPAEIKCIIDSLDNKSSSGDDYISNLILKSGTHEIVPFMVYLINMSFRNGIFPPELKKQKSFRYTKRVSRRIEIIIGPYRYLKYSVKFTNVQCITECITF